MAHTPGPWQIVEHDGGYVVENKLVDHESGAAMYDPIIWELGGIDNEANAHLIAAAPDLLITCEALAAFTRDLLKLVTPEQIKAARLTTRMLKLNDQAYNAIAKARGEL